ncbi:dipeptide ABC transporter ATP-binding protein [uncultured Pseudoflavonifractor sp.]|uniref:ABC transporter ATP-binding protein n=1 Tax=uncultured Pseudoflavonifractor sp. TaxID=1221379 RepID=UPI0025EB7615|nr:dipeptide ABC transporter ATP-binding protein [uncultured Pseudoflavonifractor sp.]
MPEEKEVLLKVDHLKTYFPIRKGFFNKVVGHVKAVDDVSFFVNRCETLGVVGESGCGKSTMGRSVLRLVEPTEGSVVFDGVDVCKLKPEEMRKFRSRMQIVFQDPLSSLDPRYTIDRTLAEPLKQHTNMTDAEIKEKVLELMEKVGLPAFHATKFPHEFSGGQRQRIGIARAISLNPEFIVCDEPVSALDVSIQSQVLNLLRELQRELKLSYLFISHDLSVVKYISDRVAVMYLGHIVEMAESEELFAHKLHPYTQALTSAIPIPNPHLTKQRIVLQGDVPNPANPPKGCPFHERCSQCKAICREERPEFKEVSPGHYVSCHLYN